MLNICLRVLATERERKTEHKMQKQNFRKYGPRSSVLPVYIAPRSSVKFPRSSGNHVCRKCWELDFSARASLHPLERTSKIWESQVEFLSSIPTFNQQIMHVVAQISHISILTRYKHQNTLLWSSISRIKHLHISN